jgi:GT2 family glycosyltransferase
MKCIRSRKQRGFGASLNVGLINTERPIVVFLHSDCEIKDRKWLINLIKSLDNLKGDGVKMVSAKSNNPGANYPQSLKSTKKPISEHDIILDKDVLEEYDYIPLYCAICNRELFNHVGGGFREYPFAWYEDLEFACRMRTADFMQGVSGNAWVWHEGNGTIKGLCDKLPKVKKIMEDNRNKCISHIKLLSAENKT